MKRKTAALYDPYLDVLGGGEKHILSILKAVEDCGYQIEVFWDKNLSQEINNKLNLKFKSIKFVPNIFKSKSFLQKIAKLRSYDIFFYVTDGSYFLSSAKKNYVFCMVPKKSLYNMSWFNRLKTFNTKFIANSVYTQKWLKQWDINTEVIYPYLSNDFINQVIDNSKKEKIILSVGRFFKHLHKKNHAIIINTFKQLQKNPQFNDFKLILVGGLKNEDQTYFNDLKLLIDNNQSIILKPNIDYKELLTLYQKSMFYWHFAGYGIDENIHPEQVEHLGLTPLEAMATGAITFCYNSGGPKEIINNDITGFLFNNEKDLLITILDVYQNQNKYQKIQNNAKAFVKNNFDYSGFKNRVKTVIQL